MVIKTVATVFEHNLIISYFNNKIFTDDKSFITICTSTGIIYIFLTTIKLILHISHDMQYHI